MLHLLSLYPNWVSTPQCFWLFCLHFLLLTLTFLIDRITFTDNFIAGMTIVRCIAVLVWKDDCTVRGNIAILSFVHCIEAIGNEHCVGSSWFICFYFEFLWMLFRIFSPQNLFENPNLSWNVTFLIYLVIDSLLFTLSIFPVHSLFSEITLSFLPYLLPNLYISLPGKVVTSA